MKKKLGIGAAAILMLIGASYLAFWRLGDVSAGDPHVGFVMEGYDLIADNFWASTSPEALSNLFRLSLQKAENASVAPELPAIGREGVSTMVAEAFERATSTEAKKALATNTLAVALYNLEPFGRSQLFSSRAETAFRQQVANIDASKDLYQDLGLVSGASVDDVERAYGQKAQALARLDTPEAKAELERVSKAATVLMDPDTKYVYDETGAEPTVGKRVSGSTLYIAIGKIAPTTFYEFGRAIVSASTTPGLASMVIDLRGNVGGALDFAPAFLGLFMGPNQYAFDFFHQNEYTPQRTTFSRLPELARYKEIAVLVDRMTQSTAEVIAAAFKRFGLGTVIGETTRGWGTVENTFPIATRIDPEESFSMLIVHSLTLRDDGEAIESRGVDPDIDVRAASWKDELSAMIRSESLRREILNQY